MSEKVQGFCPMGCGDTLFLGNGGYVTCSWEKCPNPTAMCDIMLMPETEHVVVFNEHSFYITHPLRERLLSSLDRCTLHQHISNLPGPPVKPGKYRAVATGRDGAAFWSWQELST